MVRVINDLVRYLTGAGGGGREGGRAVMYTFPLPPELMQHRLGSEPKCGMALEPMMPSAEEGPDPELAYMTRRSWVCAAVTAPLMAVAMMGMFPWLQLLLASPVVLWGGFPFFVRF